MMMIPRLIWQPNRRLPDVISAELVTMSLAGRVPIFVMALTVIIVTAYSSYASSWDILLLSLGAAILCLLAARFAIVTCYMRARSGVMPPESIRLWELRHARVMLCYAALLGVLNAVACIDGDMATHVLVVAEVFGFCAGQVARGVSRPRLCAAAVLLGALPTAVGMLVTAAQISALRESSAYLVVALLITLYAFSSLETVASNYRTLVAQLESKRQMAGLARLDALTKLPNRLVFIEQLEHEMTRVDGQSTFALHMIDLDGFKQINDKYGHPTGDGLLRAVAERLTKLLRVGDTVVRLGGDEFAVIQRNIIVPDEANLLGRRIVRQLAEPFFIGETEIYIGASDGIAHAVPNTSGPNSSGHNTSSPNTSSIDELIEHADSALYLGKRSGRGNVSTWQPTAGAVSIAA